MNVDMSVPSINGNDYDGGFGWFGEDDGAQSIPPSGFVLVRGDHVELAAYALSVIEQDDAPITHDEGKFWRYMPDFGTWEEIEDAHLDNVIAGFAGMDVFTSEGKPARALKLKAGDVSGASKILRSALIGRHGRLRFKDSPRGVAFANGFLILDGPRVLLRPHSPAHMARFAFPFAYDPNAERGMLLEFFDQVFADASEDERAARTSLLQEFVGACLFGDAPRYERCLIAFGTGGNGKGQFLEIARSVFPPEVRGAVPPQHWGERFQPAQLVGVLANFVDEIPGRDIQGGNTFKLIVSGNPTNTERKNKDPFTFTPIAGHIFNANVLPGTDDVSEGFYRRFLICPFTRAFTDKDPAKKTGVSKGIIANQIAGIVAWAIEGAVRLRETDGRYTQSEEGLRLFDDWRTSNDSVLNFLCDEEGGCGKDRGDKDPPDSWGATTFYENYREWCKARGNLPCSATKFAARVVGTGRYERQRSNGTRYVRKP